jgi:hypothetical protein
MKQMTLRAQRIPVKGNRPRARNLLITDSFQLWRKSALNEFLPKKYPSSPILPNFKV